MQRPSRRMLRLRHWAAPRARCAAASTTLRALRLEVGAAGQRGFGDAVAQTRLRVQKQQPLVFSCGLPSALLRWWCNNPCCRPLAVLPGRDGARAYDFLSQALKLADAALKHSSGDGSSSAPLPSLAPPSPETAVEGDVPPPLSPAEVRYSALTWIGRCGWVAAAPGSGEGGQAIWIARCFWRCCRPRPYPSLPLCSFRRSYLMLPPTSCLIALQVLPGGSWRGAQRGQGC